MDKVKIVPSGLHEGTVSVRSTPGEGTSFYIRGWADYTYPAAVHSEGPEREEVPSGNFSPVLLIVKDEEDIRYCILVFRLF